MKSQIRFKLPFRPTRPNGPYGNLISAVLCTVGLCAVAAIQGCSSSNAGPQVYTQVDRLARPVVNEVLATVANNRHQINDRDNPVDDSGQLANDIQGFMTFPAGRSQAITNVVKAVLVPDVLKIDLNQVGPAAYLGVETNGATGGLFGGRKLTDDVVDISLGIVFGNTVPALGLAPDDGNEIPTLASGDNVGSQNKGFITTFPFLAPRS